ncbi:hypothetical protein PISMIDRAFT_16993 [Pisolithus microcarpus 441]|uniref:Uncharacterized protein n=1 Tax=Pisolithus microcarpus 441 TaxID=765257 RepID=A0A0C9Z4B2_9AGAM|nr:hypothetical protein PISMIDRAFT_16993 [Pisolithus microcarpus 441]
MLTSDGFKNNVRRSIYILLALMKIRFTLNSKNTSRLPDAHKQWPPEWPRTIHQRTSDNDENAIHSEQ